MNPATATILGVHEPIVLLH